MARGRAARVIALWLSRVLLALALLGGARRAAAQGDASEETHARMDFAERGKYLVVSTSFTAIFDRVAFEKISSGFPTTVLVRLYVYRKAQTEAPVSLAVLELEVIYDVWDE